MLKVIKIIEGGINLETQEELPRSIVISNGQKEVLVAVNDNVIRELIGLLSSNGAPARAEPAPLLRRPPPSPRPAEAQMFSLEEPDSGDTVFGDDGFEPGEEFFDSGTGVSSL